MANELTISQIIQVAKISQYLANTENHKVKYFKGGVNDVSLGRKIYMVRKPVERMNTLNPSEPTLRQTAEYLLQMCGPFQQQALSILNSTPCISPNILTQPSSQSITTGNNVTFTVVATGTANLSYQWFKDNVPLSGKTSSSLTITGVQLTDQGNYTVSVSNGCGSVTSNAAVLTVTAGLTGDAFWGTTDYSANLLIGFDNVPYNLSFPITHGSPLSVQFPSGAANNQYLVIRYPVGEGVKTAYSNLPLNTGAIPSIAFNDVITIGSFLYIFTRQGNPFSQNTANPIIFS